MIGIIIAAIFGAFLFILMKWGVTYRDLPPGPTLLSLILGMKKSTRGNPVDTFSELRKTYGDIFSICIGPNITVVVNGLQNIRKVLVEYGEITSDRPNTFLFTEGRLKSGIIASEGSLWAEHRRFAMHALGNLGFGKRVMENRILEEAKTLIDSLENTRGEAVDPVPYLHTCMSNIIFHITLGERFNHGDKEIRRLLETQHTNTQLNSNLGPLAFIPMLKYLPGDLFHIKKIKKNDEIISMFFRRHIQEHSIPKESEDIKDYIGAYLFERKSQEMTKTSTTFTDFQLEKTLADFLLAGLETSSSTILWALVIFLHYKDVALKMKDELEKVVGNRSLPSIKDRDKLPYCRAVITEIYRHSMVVPIVGPHRNSKQFNINGYKIPKDCTLLMNFYSFMNDPDLFEKPNEFNPSRFLDENGQLMKTDLVQPFGIGKRACMGESLARMEVFLLVTALVHNFDIKPEDPDNLPSLKGQFGLTYIPLRYKVHLIKRKI